LVISDLINCSQYIIGKVTSIVGNKSNCAEVVGSDFNLFSI